jgi:cobalt-zinc-cadmium resistance protein CzcA
VRGAKLRLRPVLMTASTTALELIPLLLSSGTGNEVQWPLATFVDVTGFPSGPLA